MIIIRTSMMKTLQKSNILSDLVFLIRCVLVLWIFNLLPPLPDADACTPLADFIDHKKQQDINDRVE